MGRDFIVSHPQKIKIMKKDFFHDDDPILYLTVGQIKAVIEDAVIRTSSHHKQGDSNEVLTLDEVAKLTGYKKATLYKLTHERKIPFHKPAHGGRRIFFKRKEINQWLEDNRISTYEEEVELKLCTNLKKNKYGSEY